MLVLSRRINEVIVLTIPGLPTLEPIRITLVEVRDHYKARIGIQAPPEVVVMREELQQVIDAQAQATAGWDPIASGA